MLHVLLSDTVLLKEKQESGHSANDFPIHAESLKGQVRTALNSKPRGSQIYSHWRLYLCYIPKPCVWWAAYSFRSTGCPASESLLRPSTNSCAHSHICFVIWKIEQVRLLFEIFSMWNRRGSLKWQVNIPLSVFLCWKLGTWRFLAVSIVLPQHY